MDPDKGLEHAVYAKSKGIDYSYATDDRDLYLNQMGADGKPKVSFSCLFTTLHYSHLNIFWYSNPSVRFTAEGIESKYDSALKTEN